MMAVIVLFYFLPPRLLCSRRGHHHVRRWDVQYNGRRWHLCVRAWGRAVSGQPEEWPVQPRHDRERRSPGRGDHSLGEAQSTAGGGRQKEARKIGRGITMVLAKLSLWGELFIFLGSNMVNYWRWRLFCLRISIWGVRKQQVLEENKLLEMPELLFRYQKISLFGFKS